ncbi:hypothetical protein HanRHA438_Chr01g0011641 [Helianthus annuus]|nr:hypothetical protein HanRHA438_Chr01g0011641 [Helianthus annuus]
MSSGNARRFTASWWDPVNDDNILLRKETKLFQKRDLAVACFSSISLLRLVTTALSAQ